MNQILSACKYTAYYVCFESLKFCAILNLKCTNLNVENVKCQNSSSVKYIDPRVCLEKKLYYLLMYF